MRLVTWTRETDRSCGGGSYTNAPSEISRTEFELSEGRISQITKAALTTLRAALEQQGVEGW